MTINEIAKNNAGELKELVSLNLKRMVSDLNEFISESAIQLFDNSNMSLKITDEKSQEFRHYYSFSTRYIRDFLNYLGQKEEYSDFFNELRKANLFDIEKNLLNPQLTVFGSFVRIFIQNLTRIDNIDKYKDYMPFEYNSKLFEKCWFHFDVWISSKPIKLKYYYLLNNLKIVGKSFCFNKELGLEFRISTFKEKEELVEEMNLIPSSFTGISTSVQRMTSIAKCYCWIEGEIEILPEDLEGNFKFVDKGIIDPYYIEEALNILGFTNSLVGFLVVNNPLSPLKISMHPQFEQNKVYLSVSHFFQYPDWLDKSYSIISKTLKLNQEVKIFLTKYSLIRREHDRDSLLRLSITRLISAHRSRSIHEIFLDIVIGIESLIVEGEGSLSLQFRLNTSHLIGREYEDRTLIEKFCKVLYRIRSIIVHEGGKRSTIEKEAKNGVGGLQLTIDLARVLFRLVILRLISIEQNELVIHSRDELLNIVKPARLGKIIEKKESEIFAELYDNFIVLIKTKTKIGN